MANNPTRVKKIKCPNAFSVNPFVSIFVNQFRIFFLSVFTSKLIHENQIISFVIITAIKVSD